MPHTNLRAHLLKAIQSFHSLGQRGKAVGLVRKPPDPEPQTSPNVHPRVPNPYQ